MLLQRGALSFAVIGLIYGWFNAPSPETTGIIAMLFNNHLGFFSPGFALIGYIFGYIFVDLHIKRQDEYNAAHNFQEFVNTPSGRRETEIFQAVVSLLGYVAAGSSQISLAHRWKLMWSLTQLRLPPDAYEGPALELFRLGAQARNAPESALTFLRYYVHNPYNPCVLTFTLSLICEMMAAEGRFTVNCCDRYMEIGRKLGFSADDLNRFLELMAKRVHFSNELAMLRGQRWAEYYAPFERQQQRRSSGQRSSAGSNAGASDKLAAAYRTLGLAAGATMDAVKRAYRKLMFKYHPDRSAGLSDTEKVKHAQMAAEIQMAYEYICRCTG